MKILSTRRVALWTRELRRWLSAKFDTISIDLTPVEEKLDALLDDLPEECSKKDMEQMFDGIMLDDFTMWLPSMDIDEEGCVALNVTVDEDGCMHFEND